MSDEAIIEAAARALMTASAFGHKSDAKKLARAALTAVTPLIRADTLEEAAKVAEEHRPLKTRDMEDIAAAIRALKLERVTATPI
jgi:hypothetical protein